MSEPVIPIAEQAQKYLNLETLADEPDNVPAGRIFALIGSAFLLAFIIAFFCIRFFWFAKDTISNDASPGLNNVATQQYQQEQNDKLKKIGL
jgi:hypothetical protein